MSQSEVPPVQPVALTLRPDEGRLEGSNGRHLHAVADRSELHVGLSGRGATIRETLDVRTAVVENPQHRGYGQVATP